MSSTKPGSSQTSRVRFSKFSTPKYKVVTLAKANQPVREKLRRALPKAGSAEMLLNPNLLMTRCALNFQDQSRPSLFAAGGHAGIVRVQLLPPFRFPS
ncbi:hypothetical protein BVRB_042740 [Beta vulgaris subsp. vulgaris]|uniref:Uncharacterized protein n=1 Tax=Beta vulgaris subsp. vulgaris TaxID=3555 RepID=A0A0J8BG61_BETVV|nr:hypothetical protein BVRB_042740 [Beta vulgaris subsp. vulgaris]